MSSLGDSIEYQLAHAHESRRGQLIGVNVALISISTIAVVLRLAARTLKKAAWSYDDYLIIVSEISAYLLTTVNLISIHYGLGMHLFALPITNAYTVLKTQYFFDITYTICIQVIKASILLFYNRIFGTGRFRYIVYAVGAFLVAVWISGVLVAIFSCNPISHFWDLSEEGTCINSYAFFVAEAGLSIFTDVVILTLPIPQVWRLKVSVRQKVGLSGIFLLGGFVCVGSAIRLTTIDQLFTDDPTWTSYGPAIWTLIEVNIGIVCACLPILCPLFVRIAGLGLCSKTDSSTRSNAAGRYNRYFGQWSWKSSKKSKWSATGTTLVSTTDEPTASIPQRDARKPTPKNNPAQVIWTADERWEGDPIDYEQFEMVGQEPRRREDLESQGWDEDRIEVAPGLGLAEDRRQELGQPHGQEPDQDGDGQEQDLESHHSPDGSDRRLSKHPSSTGSLGLPLQAP